MELANKCELGRQPVRTEKMQFISFGIFGRSWGMGESEVTWFVAGGFVMVLFGAFRKTRIGK